MNACGFDVWADLQQSKIKYSFPPLHNIDSLKTSEVEIQFLLYIIYKLSNM